MKYCKLALTFEEQADLLISKGLSGDRHRLIETLKVVNYYHLAPYWRHFQKENGSFENDAQFENVCKLYVFDRQLRYLVSDAIGRIEIAVKSLLITLFSKEYGAFGYLDVNNFSKDFQALQHSILIHEIRRRTEKSKEEFIKHHREKYPQTRDLPFWMAAEMMTFRNVITVYRNIEHYLQRDISRHYNLPAKVFNSWMPALLYVKETCLFQSNLWDRELPVKPLLPNSKNAPEWHSPVKFNNDRIFVILCILRYMLNYVSPGSNWPKRLEELLSIHPEIPLEYMGFPEKWTDCFLWTDIKPQEIIFSPSSETTPIWKEK